VITLGRYAKFWTAAIGMALTVASAKYGGTTWMPYLIAAAGALGVYGVPNNTPPPPAAKPAAVPAEKTLIRPDGPEPPA
jgi:hypothetical protein